MSKTRLDNDGFMRLKRKLDLQHGFQVPKIGLGGGLAFFWWDNVDIDAKHLLHTILMLDKIEWCRLALHWILRTS